MKKEDIHLRINGNRIILSERSKILEIENVIMDKAEPYVSDVLLALFKDLGDDSDIFWVLSREVHSKSILRETK